MKIKKEDIIIITGIIFLILFMIGAKQSYDRDLQIAYEQGQINGARYVCANQEMPYIIQNITQNISREVFCNIILKS